MTDHPLRDELRAVVPTLEPDEVFLAQLSARAAAGAGAVGPARAAGGWRVALAPVAVAAVLVGIAWLTGLRPDGLSDPSPAPAPTDSVTQVPSPDATRHPARSTPRSHPTGSAGTTATDSTDGADRDPGTGPGSGAGAASGQGSGQGSGQDSGQDSGQGSGPAQGAGEQSGASTHGQGHAHGHTKHPNGKDKHPHGPDEHAGDHPAPQAGQDRHRR